MRTKTLSVVCVLCCALALACSQSKPADQAQPAAAAPTAAAEPAKPATEPQKPAAPAPAAAPVAATPAIDEASFSLHLVEAGPYKAGELGRVVVQLEPHGIYHVNQEYPIEIALTGDADTAYPKTKLERADAAEFGEHKAKFDVPFTAKVAGDHKVLANVKFAVCTKENCVPDERDLALTVAVK